MKQTRSFYKGVIKLLFLFQLLGLIIGVSAVPAFAEDSAWNTPYDPFFNDPNFEVTTETTDDGEKRQVMIPGKTRINQTRKDGNVSTLLIDISGHGAVLCMKSIFLLMKTELDRCQNFDYPKLHEHSNTAIYQINKFVTEHSVPKITMDQLVKADEERNASGGKKICDSKNSDILNFIKLFDQTPQKELDNRLKELLSVPRLPAMNPCL